MKAILAILFLLTVSLTTPVAWAAHVSGHGCTGPDDASQGCPADPELGGGGGLQYSLESPLKSNIITIEDLLTTILNVLLVIAVPIIVFFIIFAGFTYVTAQGNPEKIKTATRSLTYAIIGAVLILGGVAISEIIASVVESFRT
jgi:hypothetical protein